MAESERVQKILAKAGIASRRKCEELIVEGSVTINGKVAKLGDKAQFGQDAIKVNGKLLRTIEAKVYLAFFKPRAVISMLTDQDNRPNLGEYLGKVHSRVFPIGRLDFNSEGLILLTNDGDFAEKIQRRDDIPRVYNVKVKGKVDAEAIRRLQKGARLETRMVRPHSVRIARELEAKSEIQIVILGGGAVDIRALCEMKGLLVDRITRTAIGHITLRGLAPGHFRLLKVAQAEALLDHPELGLKLLEDEVEAEKPKGQRNYHEKKVEIAPLDSPLKPARPERASARMERTPRVEREPSRAVSAQPASRGYERSDSRAGSRDSRSDSRASRSSGKPASRGYANSDPGYGHFKAPASRDSRTESKPASRNYGDSEARGSRDSRSGGKPASRGYGNSDSRDSRSGGKSAPRSYGNSESRDSRSGGKPASRGYGSADTKDSRSRDTRSSEKPASRSTQTDKPTSASRTKSSPASRSAYGVVKPGRNS